MRTRSFVAAFGLFVALASPAFAQSAAPGQEPSNEPGAPGTPGLSVSPSQIPESQRLQPPPNGVVTPTGQTSPGLLTPSGQTSPNGQLQPGPTGLIPPTGQAAGGQLLGPNAFVVAPPVQSQLLRQGTADERELAVYERPLPDYDPVGLRAGSFLIFPSLDLSDGYNSNIYASQSSAVGDDIGTISPTISVRSNFQEDQLNADISSADAFYVDHTSENYNDYQASVNGRHYFTDTIVGFGRASAGHLTEARYSPNAQSPSEPTQYDDYTAYAGLAQTGLRLQLQGDAFYEHLLFYSVPSPSGIISNGFQNHDQVVSTLRAGYEITHQLIAFVRGAYNDRMYPETDGGYDRDSHGLAADAGVDLDLNSIFVAEAFVGALHQDYNDSRFANVTKPDLGLDAVWNVTPRTSVLFDAVRSIDETTLLPASSILTTTLSTGVQYQFLPQLQGRLDYGHSFEHYNNTGFDDNVDTVSAGANYFIGRNIVVRPYVAYQSRDSNRPTADYGQFQAVMDLTLRY